MLLPLTRSAGLAGIGLLAGLAGALAMALSQKAEIAATGRAPSDSPAEAVEKVTGLAVPDQAKPSLSTATHLAFGTSLGLGLAAMTRVPEPARGTLFFAGAWGMGASILTGLGISKPPTEWDGRQLATDLGHHAVYAGTAAAAFLGLRRLFRL